VSGLPAVSRFMNQDSGYPSPDFVLFGMGDGAGGVMLLASSVLSQASLNRSVPGYLIGMGMRIPDYAWELTCEMRQVTIIRAGSYADAFRTLMNTWKPPEPQGRPALPQ
jgi:hypothetical protein